MSHSPIRRIRPMAVLAVIALGLAACSSDGGNANGKANGNGNATGQNTGCENAVRVNADGVTDVPASNLQTQLDALAKATLTPVEIENLSWMREEEKLAHDVYVALGEKWNIKTFENIAAAETTHTDAVKALLDRYGVQDPAAGTSLGEFTNPDIQSLYTNLVDQGSASLVDALTVGAAIEDLDIADLQARATTTPDIALVYANLEKGSRNHLRAFVKQLDKNNASYAPTHITQAAYDAIVSSDIERGTAG